MTNGEEKENMKGSASSKLKQLLAMSEARVRLIGELGGKFGYESDSLIIVFGAITTPERLNRFAESLCYLCDDGVIRRFGRDIGTFENIETVKVNEDIAMAAYQNPR